MKYEAVVFDMDGVLADSEPTYYAAINTVVATLGHSVTPEQQRALMGHGVYETWDYLAGALNLEGPLDDLIAQYDRELCRQLALQAEPLPGVRILIDELKRRRMPIGLASSSWPGWIEALTTGLGLQGAFDAVVSSTMVEHGKPAPDIYLLAAERIGVDPTRCIAIEDTPTGLNAANAAGMFTVQVRSASTAFEPRPEADLVLQSLLDFSLSLLADG